MSRKPLVSVRIPSYNHEAYIGACIKSILAQTFGDFEIVIVDDCSTDRSVEVIKSFRDPRIRLEVLPRNCGMNVAVERCVELCRGKYIANISSDDMWEPLKLEKQVAFLENHRSYDAVFTDVNFIGDEGVVLTNNDHPYFGVFDSTNRTPSQWLRRFFYSGNCLCNPSVLIRASVYRALHCQDKRLVSLSDFDLWVRFSLRGHRLWVLDEKLTLFRILGSEGNLSAATSGNRNRGAFEYKQILSNFLNIQDPWQLIEIFPECLAYGSPVRTTIPYFLGILAVRQGSDYHRLWGCEAIFTLLGNPHAARELERRYDFRYVDFLALTKTTDFFGNLKESGSNKIAPALPTEHPITASSGSNLRLQRVKVIAHRISPRLYGILKSLRDRIR